MYINANSKSNSSSVANCLNKRRTLSTFSCAGNAVSAISLIWGLVDSKLGAKKSIFTKDALSPLGYKEKGISLCLLCDDDIVYTVYV